MTTDPGHEDAEPLAYHYEPPGFTVSVIRMITASLAAALALAYAVRFAQRTRWRLLDAMDAVLRWVA